MNEEQLEKLLAEKKARCFQFEQSEEEFLADFMVKTADCSRPRLPIRFWRYAAIVAAAIGIALPAWISRVDTADPPPLQVPKQPVIAKTVPPESLDPMRESLRLFGNDVAVLFIDNDLVIGERLAEETPSNLLQVKLARGVDLKIACADKDSISVNSPGISGNVIVSRSDQSTLVLDIDLLIEGHRVNTQIPVDRSGFPEKSRGTHS